MNKPKFKYFLISLLGIRQSATCWEQRVLKCFPLILLEHVAKSQAWIRIQTINDPFLEGVNMEKVQFELKLGERIGIGEWRTLWKSSNLFSAGAKSRTISLT